MRDSWFAGQRAYAQLHESAEVVAQQQSQMAKSLQEGAASASAIEGAVPKAVELTVLVPTFNEAGNVEPLTARLASCLDGIAWEVIFVDDDSPDGTAERVRAIGRSDRRVRCLQRVGRRGLASACIEGMLASSAPYLAVIDGDLQHDEKLLPKMLRILRTSEVDIVIGSRFMRGGGVGEWDHSRLTISRVARRLSRLLLRTELSDPMSGFFMVRREAFEEALRQLSGLGFKVLVDLFASVPRPLRFEELPYRFRSRQAGESKLDSHAVWGFLMLLMDKLMGRVVPARFVSFSLIGGFGVLVHMTVLTLVYERLAFSFSTSQAVATMVAMVFNFALNNALTFRDMRLTGWRWLRGLASFSLACSVGAIANVGIATYLFRQDTFWIFSGLAGVAVGAVWNYALTSLYTWGRP
jgi:dolichol-phosphate mannosyltransferase